jgi:hypothetical protein
MSGATIAPITPLVISMHALALWPTAQMKQVTGTSWPMSAGSLWLHSGASVIKIWRIAGAGWARGRCQIHLS